MKGQEGCKKDGRDGGREMPFVFLVPDSWLGLVRVSIEVVDGSEAYDGVGRPPSLSGFLISGGE